MPQSKKGVPQHGNQNRRKNLQAMNEKDGFIKQLQEIVTKRDDELKKVREVALEFKEIILQLQTQNKEFQNMACDKLDLMIELENENFTLKGAMKKKEESVEAKEYEFRRKDEIITELNEKIGQQDVELGEKNDEIKIIRELLKENQQKFKDEIQSKSKEICLCKKQSEVAMDKFASTTEKLGFKQSEVDPVVSGVNTKLDKLHEAGEKLKTLNFAYNERVNYEIEKQKFFFRISDAFGKNKLLENNNNKVSV